MSFGFPTEIINEGNAEVLVPRLKAFVKEAWEYAPSKAPVFYNPAMALNRDLAVLALQAYQRLVKRELVACEPLAGCGVRGIRLAKEVEGIRRVVINDISSQATKLIEFNVKLNNLVDKATVANEDANLLLSRHAAPRKRFDYVDVDPFGSPVPYTDSALRAVRDGGMLAFTATDMAPLCGVHSKACIRKYGGKPLRTEYCHELAVRLLAGCLASMAAKHEIGVNPLLSYSEYNYVRTYATISYGAKHADKSIQALGYILHCFSCFHRETSKGLTSVLKRNCPECGSRFQVAGPLWLGSLWDQEFCTRLMDEVRELNVPNKAKVLNLLMLINKEINTPITYYVVDKLCDEFSLPVPSLSKVITKLKSGGFEAVSTHFNRRAVRTDASATTLKAIVTKLANPSSESEKSI